MTRRIVIEGGTIVTDSEQYPADLLIAGEQIAALVNHASNLDADERIDATGLLVMPGVIDVHTHFRAPDPASQEGFLTGSRAAAAGGVTTVVEMPHANPTTSTAAQFAHKIRTIKEASIIDFALWGGVLGGADRDAEALDGMAQLGAVGFKSFMAASSPSFATVDTAKLYWAMQTLAGHGLPYALHAEDDDTLQNGLRKMAAAGRTDALAHAESRPPLVEVAAVAQAIYLAEITGCWIHICHCASAAALQLIVEARQRGVQVTVETCPQYLALNSADLERLAGFAKCAPALREQAEVDQIWQYMFDGTIDIVCSDHAAYTFESKAAGGNNIFDAPNGITGVQTLLPVLFDAAVYQRDLPPCDVVRLLCANPATVFGLANRKGFLQPGADADVILFDPHEEWTVKGDEMHYRNKWTPYDGKRLHGRVKRTLRRGETLYTDAADPVSRHAGEPGSGYYLPHGYGPAT